MAIEGNGGTGGGGSPHDLVNQILQRAREGGARPPALNDDDDDGDEEYSNDEDDGDVASGKQKVFSGTARKITDSDSGMKEAASSSLSSAAPTTATSHTPSSSRRSLPKKVTRTLTFWQDGFSLDHEDRATGALHPYSDPGSQRLLQILQSGQAPLELLQVEPGQAVDLRVVHRMGEPYRLDEGRSASNSSTVAFAGKPQRLGDMAEPLKSPSPSATATASAHEVEGFDASKPATTLQLRLSNGARQTATLNSTQTIKDLHNHVSRINSSQGGRTAVTLLAGRPPVRLEASDERTLADAGLLGSVIIVQ